ncbi:hypothetical protein T484DRAFT_3627637, partial [Baffinella frigidus]
MSISAPLYSTNLKEGPRRFKRTTWQNMTAPPGPEFSAKIVKSPPLSKIDESSEDNWVKNKKLCEKAEDETKKSLEDFKIVKDYFEGQLCKSREEKEALQKFHEAELEQVAKLVFIEQTTASSLELKNALQDQRAVHTVALTKVREQLKSALQKNTLKDFQRTSLDKLVSEKLKDVTEIHNRKNK